MTIRTLVALLFAGAAVGVFVIGQPLDLADIKAAAICAGIAGFVYDSSKVWALLERAADKVFGALKEKP